MRTTSAVHPIDTATCPAHALRMEKKPQIDTFGAASLIFMALLLAFNQVLVRVVNDGLQPVFFAALRSLGAAFCIWLWIRWRGLPVARPDCHMVLLGLAIGAMFAVEFILLFVALDHTTVARSSILLNSMPVWLAIGAHFVLPGDRMTPRKACGLALAMAGVALAMSGKRGGDASLLGDGLALAAAVAWAGLALMARGTRLRDLRPEVQLMWQVAVSGPLLLLAAPLFGPFIRELTPLHIAGLGFQIVVVVSAGFIFWLWLLSIYPASGVASFSFLSPVFGVALGWALLSEEVGLALIGALCLVAAGIVLINRPARKNAYRRDVSNKIA